jgi:carbonic anhydrase/acetyltransferase-like protein (isoleucine patch superfamily)
MNAQRRFDIQSAVYVTLIYGVPALAASCATAAQTAIAARAAVIIAAPLLYATLFAVVAGALSLPHQKGIIPGKFLRRLSNPVYYDRRIYGLCWTCLYYCKPVYFIVLNVPWLKALTFRLFGYRGSLDFTIYPDTWIRDLPLLQFGSGSYIGNRACIGSNQCFGAEHILVEGITVEERGVVGHLAMVAPGARIGPGAELGAGSAVGMRANIGRKAKVGAVSAVSHGAFVGEHAEIGAMAWVGTSARVEPGAVLLPAQAMARGATLAASERPLRRRQQSAQRT